MKFIHCADLHLDSKIDSLPTDKAKIRREEVIHSFERLAQYATTESVSAVIISGDMFDSMRVSAKTKGRVLQAILSNSTVDFLYLSGNHDEDNFLSNIEDMPKNLKVFNDDWTCFEYGNVLISGIKFTPANYSTVYDTLNLPVDKFNIVVMHGQVAGYKSLEKAEIISITSLKEKNVDYLALGHIHSFSSGKIDERGDYAYSGCLDARGFDETGSKGFVMLDVNEGHVEKHFVEFSSRCFYEVELNIDQSQSWFAFCEGVVKTLSNDYSPSSLIKVVLTGEHVAEFDFDREILENKLNQVFFFAKVYDKTKLKISLEDYSTDKSIKGEFIRTVMGSDLSFEEKNKIILCGIKALRGEEI